jgi:hypothetical protein
MSRTPGNPPVPVNSSVSIVCVYTDPAIRREWLDRSVHAYGRHAPGVEYLPVDNVDGRYRSAGATLNHGASLAGNDVIVFVHQDVFLHSPAAAPRNANRSAEHSITIQSSRQGIDHPPAPGHFVL